MGNVISKDVFDHLLAHMLDIHRKKLGIVSAYTLDYDSYTCKLNFLNSYIKGIEAFLESALPQNETTDLPFVIMGSTVHLRRTNVNKCVSVKIVLPSEQTAKKEDGNEPYVCFSDWGHALLLKHAGERIMIGNPLTEYIVERITMNIRSKTQTEKSTAKK